MVLLKNVFKQMLSSRFTNNKNQYYLQKHFDRCPVNKKASRRVTLFKTILNKYYLAFEATGFTGFFPGTTSWCSGSPKGRSFAKSTRIGAATKIEE